jgi:hypothetical protein
LYRRSAFAKDTADKSASQKTKTLVVDEEAQYFGIRTESAEKNLTAENTKNAENN